MPSFKFFKSLEKKYKSKKSAAITLKLGPLSVQTNKKFLIFPSFYEIRESKRSMLSSCNI